MFTAPNARFYFISTAPNARFYFIPTAPNAMFYFIPTAPNARFYFMSTTPNAKKLIIQKQTQYDTKRPLVLHSTISNFANPERIICKDFVVSRHKTILYKNIQTG